MKDNGVTGGIMVPLDITTRNFTDYGFMRVMKKKVSVHPDSGVPFKGNGCPLWELAVSRAIDLHKQFYNIHSIGWDIAFLQDDVCFIEGNDNWHVVDIQLNEPGKELFKKYFK